MSKNTKSAAPKSVKSGEPTREPNWSPRRVAIVKAMRALGADGPTSAASAEDIMAKASKAAPELADRVDLVKIVLDVYRTSELLHNGFAKSVKHEGERGLRYYLTAKGMKTEFPQPKKAEPKKAAEKKDAKNGGKKPAAKKAEAAAVEPEPVA